MPKIPTSKTNPAAEPLLLQDVVTVLENIGHTLHTAARQIDTIAWRLSSQGLKDHKPLFNPDDEIPF